MDGLCLTCLSLSTLSSPSGPGRQLPYACRSPAYASGLCWNICTFVASLVFDDCLDDKVSLVHVLKLLASGCLCGILPDPKALGRKVTSTALPAFDLHHFSSLAQDEVLSSHVMCMLARLVAACECSRQAMITTTSVESQKDQCPGQPRFISWCIPLLWSEYRPPRVAMVCC